MYDLKTFRFVRGSHKTREDGLCVMEAVAYLAGEPHSDHPACACPVITALAIWLNDSADDELRQTLLAEMPWRIVGTKAAPEIEERRAYMAVDWSVRVICPSALRRLGLDAEAAALESLAEIDEARAGAACDAMINWTRAAECAVRAADSRKGNNAAQAVCEASYAASAMHCGCDSVAMMHVSCALRTAVLWANSADFLSLIESCAALLDCMIRMTEPQERTLPIREEAKR